MRRLIAIIVILAAGVSPALPTDAQYGRQITVTAGTPIRVVSTRTLVASVFVQMKHGGSGLGLIYSANPSESCSAGTLVAELSPASPTAPGGAYVFPSNDSAGTQQGGYDMNWLCVDGSNSGDVMIVSWNPK